MNRSDLSLLMLKVAFDEASEAEVKRLEELRRKYPQVDSEFEETKAATNRVGKILAPSREVPTEEEESQLLARMQAGVSRSLAEFDSGDEESSSPKIVKIFWAGGLAAAAAIAILLAIKFHQPGGMDQMPVATRDSGNLRPAAELLARRSNVAGPPDAYLLVSGDGAEINAGNIRYKTRTTIPLMMGDRFKIREDGNGLLFVGGQLQKLKPGESGMIDPGKDDATLSQFFSLSLESFLKNVKVAAPSPELSPLDFEPIPEEKVIERVEDLAIEMLSGERDFDSLELLKMWKSLPERYRNDPLISRFGLKLYAETGLEKEFNELKDSVLSRLLKD